MLCLKVVNVSKCKFMIINVGAIQTLWSSRCSFQKVLQLKTASQLKQLQFKVILGIARWIWRCNIRCMAHGELGAQTWQGKLAKRVAALQIVTGQGIDLGQQEAPFEMKHRIMEEYQIMTHSRISRRTSNILSWYLDNLVQNVGLRSWIPI